jgi:hypothetical protein
MGEATRAVSISAITNFFDCGGGGGGTDGRSTHCTVFTDSLHHTDTIRAYHYASSRNRTRNPKVQALSSAWKTVTLQICAFSHLSSVVTTHYGNSDQHCRLHHHLLPQTAPQLTAARHTNQYECNYWSQSMDTSKLDQNVTRTTIYCSTNHNRHSVLYNLEGLQDPLGY